MADSSGKWQICGNRGQGLRAGNLQIDVEAILADEVRAVGVHDRGLERDGTTGWEGVRNYQVRNFLRDDIQVGDRCCSMPRTRSVRRHRPGEIARAGYPDPFA